MHRRMIGFLTLLALAGCAGISVQPLGPGDTTTAGVRFARPRPYVSITKDGDKLEAKLVWLPDLEEQYSVQWSAGLFGSVNPDITLQDGWMLTTLSGEIQSGGSTTKDLFSLFAPAADAETKELRKELQPGLYELDAVAENGHTRWKLGAKILG